MCEDSNVFLQAMYSAPAVVGEIVAYTVPAYLLAGIHYRDSKDLDSFYMYIGAFVTEITSSTNYKYS